VGVQFELYIFISVPMVRVFVGLYFFKVVVDHFVIGL